ncbi:PTS mannose/fructose/sorbose/N-acetylgalactosamine transporter subunit IIC [Laedolimicola sp.]|uniref:PTS mannose/fructose/sorbose/N-acetylgalactosamine transporter subunit IIC n=1 Tax=Laedolimicola sp. TaxID=2981663 RepID=UPI003F7F13ED
MMQAIFIGIVAFIGFLECGVGNSMIQRPIVMGPLVGLVLGDVQTGLAVGATLELAFMGNVTIGAALPPEITAGGILGTALAISSHGGTEAALALAIPIATVALLLKNTYYLVVRAWLLHKSDEYAAKGDADGVDRMHMVSFLSYALVMAIVMAVCYSFGAPAVEKFLAVIPQFVKDGISVAAGILPALGFALLASMLLTKKVAPFFMLGFILSAYLGMPVLGIAMLGVIIVALMLNQDKPAAVAAETEGGDDDDF